MALYAYSPLPAQSFGLQHVVADLVSSEERAARVVGALPHAHEFLPRDGGHTTSLTLARLDPSVEVRRAAVHSSESYLDMRARWSETWQTSRRRKKDTDDVDVLSLAMNLWW